MGLSNLVLPFPWSRYSKKLISKIENPRCLGFFSEEDSHLRGLRLIVGRAGNVDDGNALWFYWLIDRNDGVIADSKFQIYGQSALIGAAEVACELIIEKNYDQAKRIGADLIDKQVRDRPDDPAFPKETHPHLNLVIEAIEQCVEQCTDLPLPKTYMAPPMALEFGETLEGGYPGWDTLSVDQKRSVIESVIERDIRPYIELDAGGIDIKEIRANNEVLIAYKGSCTSCFSSVGTTLTYIQHILRAKVHPDLNVIPDLDSLAPHLH